MIDSYATMTLLGGLVLFFYGIQMANNGIQKAAGHQLRHILAKLTRNPVSGFLAGILITIVMQSSTATTVMLVGFVHGGLMTFKQSLAVLLGTGIGTTITAQLVAFKLTRYALWGAVLSYPLQWSKNQAVKTSGEILFGISLLFYGMELMGEGMAPLEHAPALTSFISHLETPFYALCIGTVLTALIHSSAAVIGIVMVMAEQELITLDASLALMFGANIGTSFTAILFSLSTDREAKRVALANILLKVGGVALFFWWIPSFSHFLNQEEISLARTIANAHTIFNIAIGLFFFPFINYTEKLIYTLIPEKKKDLHPHEVIKLTYIDEQMAASPSLALDLSRKEIGLMAKEISRMLHHMIELFEKEFDPQIIDTLKHSENKVDFFDKQITAFLLSIQADGSSREISEEIFALISVIKNMENIGDLVNKNVIRLAYKKQSLGEHFSDEGMQELKNYHLKICKQIVRLTQSLTESSVENAQLILEKMDSYLKLEDAYRLSHVKRMMLDMRSSIQTHDIHMELLDLMKQINVYIGNVAKSILMINN